jgi:hypothetical protein
MKGSQERRLKSGWREEDKKEKVLYWKSMKETLQKCIKYCVRGAPTHMSIPWTFSLKIFFWVNEEEYH